MHRRTRPDPGRHGARLASRLLAIALLPLALSTGSCTREIDFKQVLEMTEVTSGWFDAGVVQGRNKIVPSVSLRFRKKAPADLERISVNALFRASDGKESKLDNDVFVQRVDFEGEQTPPITIRAENGYTADPPQSRADMLMHSEFREMRVQILVKQGASQWADMGWIDIKRQLITQ